ncbi:MAG: hypothetical protein ACOX4I_08775 [Anaerovoracaceae bacterium]|jgi:hypothetical protein
MILINNDDSKTAVALGTMRLGRQLREPGTFLKGLDELAAALPEADDGASAGLREAFGPVLQDDARTPLNMIKNCMDNGLYDMALLFIANEVPKVINDKRVVYFDKAEAPAAEISRLKNRLGMHFQDDELFIFNRYINSLFYFKRNTNEALRKGCKGRDEENDKIFLAAIDALDDFYKTVVKKLGEDFDIDSSDLETIEDKSKLVNYFGEPDRMTVNVGNRKAPVQVQLKTDLELTSQQEVAGMLMRMHKALREWNDRIANGDPCKPPIEKLGSAVKLYVRYAQYLLD